MQGLSGHKTGVVRREKNRRVRNFFRMGDAPKGIARAASASSASPLPYRGWAVSVRPGAMALTLIRYGASSSAIARVIETTPPLLAT